MISKFLETKLSTNITIAALKFKLSQY